MRFTSRMIQASLALVSLIALNACATTPMPGLLYSDSHQGLVATSNQAGNRVGESCSNTYIGLISSGDASIETARRNGGITMITSVDSHTKSVFLFYSQYCTIVRGR